MRAQIRRQRDDPPYAVWFITRVYLDAVAQDFKLISLKMIVSSILHHQKVSSKKALTGPEEVALTTSRPGASKISARGSEARMSLSKISSRMSSFEVCKCALRRGPYVTLPASASAL